MGIRFFDTLLCLSLVCGLNFSSSAAHSNSPNQTPKQETTKHVVDPKLQEPTAKAPIKPPVPAKVEAKVVDPKLAEPMPAVESKLPQQDSTQKPIPTDPLATEKAMEIEPVLDEAKSESEPDKPARILSSELLPVATKAWFSIPDIDLLEEQFDKTQYGKLAANPEVKPFVDSLKKQAQEWLDEKNVRLGVRMEDIDEIHVGEICIAGVMQDLEGGQPARGSHGLVLLVDVAGNETKVAELFGRINAELVKQKGAVQEELKISEIPVTKITIKNPKRIRQSQYSFQTTHAGWLLVADNEEIFRDIIRRLAAPERIRKDATLSTQANFSEVMKQTELFGNQGQFRWFVDPFGYLQLAQKIEAEEQDVRKPVNDWPGILQAQGFDAIRGMGGNVALSLSVEDQDFEVLNRTYVFAPKSELADNQKRIFDLFDFSPAGNTPPVPADWVPADASGYFSANWDFTKLLESVGHLYNAFIDDEPDAFERMIKDLKNEPDFQLDVRKLVGMLDDQFSIVSTTERPVSETSERLVVGLRLKAGADANFVFSSIKRAVGRKNGKPIVLAGFNVIEVDTTVESEPFDMEPELQLPPGFEVEAENSDKGGQAEAKKQGIALFEKRYFVVHKGFLLVANDKDYLKKLLTSHQKVRLHETEDFLLIKDALGKLTDEKRISFRQFSRIDRAIETNYEMLRRGEMVQSQTVLAKILNRVFETEKNENAAQPPRVQKLDGSKLPEDFAKSVAPYLGPSGWVLETETDGWRVTGCTIKKKGVSEVVRKLDEHGPFDKSQR